MIKEEIKQALQLLSTQERETLLAEIENNSELHFPLLEQRRNQFNNKVIGCPHCTSKNFHKHGIDKGSQRYYCKSCKKTFTEFTGTWISGIHKKELLVDYLKLMEQEQSLDKIKDRLKINKKTAFDWRHKVLSSFENVDSPGFVGITESDETFFLHSCKGQKLSNRRPRKRGKSVRKRGNSNEQVAVIVSTDRNKTMDMKVATLGRITKADIEKTIGEFVSSETILCSDGHVSYKAFAIDRDLEHHVIRANLKEHVKQGKYHIQHVNSIDSHLKRWIEYRFLGVSTKYLQRYLHWFRIKQKLKKSRHFLSEFTELSLKSNQAKQQFKSINQDYTELIKNTTLN